jgi:hypothetical protein
LAVAPLAFLEMKIEIDLNAVEPGETALGEAPERLDAIDVSAAFGEGFLFVDADMLVEADVHQPVIARPAIGANDAGGIDPAPDNGSQRGLGTVFDDLRIDLSMPLEDAEDRLLEGSSAAQAWQWAASYPARSKVAFIDFHDSLELAALHRPLDRDQQPKSSVQRIDCLSIESQQVGRLRSRQIEAKALQDFFDPVLGQFAPLEHVALGLP